MPLPEQLWHFLEQMEPLLQPGCPASINSRVWLKQPQATLQLALTADSSSIAHSACLSQAGTVLATFQVLAAQRPLLCEHYKCSLRSVSMCQRRTRRQHGDGAPAVAAGRS
jgi:hypothetical protein